MKKTILINISYLTQVDDTLLDYDGSEQSLSMWNHFEDGIPRVITIW